MESGAEQHRARPEWQQQISYDFTGVCQDQYAEIAAHDEFLRSVFFKNVTV